MASVVGTDSQETQRLAGETVTTLHCYTPKHGDPGTRRCTLSRKLAREMHDDDRDWLMLISRSSEIFERRSVLMIIENRYINKY